MQSSIKNQHNDEAQYSRPDSSNTPVFGSTDVGKVRSHNEDCFFLSPEKNLYIVADGMGGYDAGEIASRLAVELIDEYFTLDLIFQLRKGNKDIGSELKRSLRVANEKILKMAADNPSYQGMGCTVVIALIIGDGLHLCHVGDSRAYVSNQTGIHLTTTDHSAVMDLVKAGRMTLEQARKSPAKNRLSQAVGAHGPVDPDYGFYHLKDRDYILLCSDGLWDMVSDQEIFHILKQQMPVNYHCDKLVRAANDAGGYDNITVVVIQYRQEDDIDS